MVDSSNSTPTTDSLLTDSTDPEDNIEAEARKKLLLFIIIYFSCEAVSNVIIKDDDRRQYQYGLVQNIRIGFGKFNALPYNIFLHVKIRSV